MRFPHLRHTVLTAGLLMLGAAGPAYASDWNGCYAGAAIGAASADMNTEDAPFEKGDFGGSGASWNSGGPPYETIKSDASAFTGGLTGGCDWAMPRERLTFVFGVVGDLSAWNLESNSVSSLSSDTHVDYDMNLSLSVRARAGIALGNVLFYGTGGLVASDLSLDVSDSQGPGLIDISNSAFQGGWVAGAGVEFKLNERWSAQLEYQHMQFGVTATGEAIDPVGAVPRFEGDVNIDIVRLGLLLRL